MSVNWEEIYNTELLFFKDCYSTCDSYCCKNFLGESFRILPKECVTLALLEGEYEYYSKKGGICNLKEPKKETFLLKNGKEFSLYFLSCFEKGLCNPHSLRPLICRIYPYFPKVNAKGEILGFKNASLMDLFFSTNAAHPCTLAREHSQAVQNDLKRNLKPLLKYPLLIFTFGALEILCDFLVKKMQDDLGKCGITSANVDLLNDAQKEVFFKKLEWNLMRRKAWDCAEFKEKVSAFYDEVALEFGDFL